MTATPAPSRTPDRSATPETPPAFTPHPLRRSSTGGGALAAVTGTAAAGFGHPVIAILLGAVALVQILIIAMPIFTACRIAGRSEKDTSAVKRIDALNRLIATLTTPPKQ